MAVMRGNRVGGNWLMKWDELKKNSHGTLIDWCTGRGWPLNCMTVISAWWRLNIRWTSNDYIIQLSSTSQSNWVPVPVEFDAQRASGVASRVPDSWRGDVGKPHPTEGALGYPDGVWGPEKMLIRCSKESQHPAEWAVGLWLSSPREQERHNVTAIRVRGQNITVYVRSPAPSHTQTLNNPFEPLQ